MGKIERVSGWESRLNRLLQDRLNTPFEWGTNDCVSFACTAIREITEQDLIQEHRGEYRSEEGAFERLAAYGESFPAQISKLFEPFNKVTNALLWSGDVALVRHPRGLSVAVYHSGRLFAPGEQGLDFLPLDEGLKFWGVGHE